MPDLDLGDPAGLDLRAGAGPSQARSTAALRLAATMAWPDDAGRRAEHWERVEAKALPPLGAEGAGVDAAVAAVLALMAEKAPSWYIAGSVVHLVRTMAQYHPDIRGGPSVGKAMALLERFTEGPAKPPDRQALRATWTAFKPVAHLCAAFVSLLNEVRRRPDEEQDALAGALFFDMLGILLALGRDYQAFATAYRAPGRQAPLLAADAIWTVPARLALPSAKVQTAPFSARTLAALKDYRAG